MLWIVHTDYLLYKSHDLCIVSCDHKGSDQLVLTTLPAAELVRIFLPGQVEVQSYGSVQSDASVVIHDHIRGAGTDGLLHFGQLLLPEANTPPVLCWKAKGSTNGKVLESNNNTGPCVALHTFIICSKVQIYTKFCAHTHTHTSKTNTVESIMYMWVHKKFCPIMPIFNHCSASPILACTSRGGSHGHYMAKKSCGNCLSSH